MKLYLDTTILAALTYFKDKDIKRYAECKRLIEESKEKESTLVISFYSIHELFLLPFDYMDEKTARELTELLSREKRILHQD